MSRFTVVFTLGLALLFTVSGALAMFFAEPSPSCSRHTVPVHFTKVATEQLSVGRSKTPFPIVEFTYTISGTRYQSNRMFCTPGDRVTIDQNAVKRFFIAAEQNERVVAWVTLTQPERACISLTDTFSHATVDSTSNFCLAPP